MTEPACRRKLIEVALPLEAINAESAREKSIRHGHPSTLHLWWSRKPLSTCRAVLFASLVDDPSSHPERFPTEEAQAAERERLFRIIEELVKWENSGNERVLAAAREEIARSCDGAPPPVLDPFCGGGSIPLEAQRLGLEAHGSDLNPVAVLITKALIEIPPRFADRPPVHPEARAGRLDMGQWRGAAGLAEDVRRYGAWMRDEAASRIGHLYPKVSLPPEHGGGEATVIAWLWARTVRCPNPACGAEMPLTSKWWLSKKKGKQAWVEPIVDRAAKTVRFEVRTGEGVPQDGTVDRRGARCIVCGSPVPFDHVRAEGRAGRMGATLMAIVADGRGGRVYLPPSEEHARIARSAKPTWRPDQQLHGKCRVNVPLYGMDTFADLFTPRQLVALTTFSDLVGEARERVLADAIAAGMPDDGIGLEAGGTGATAYADAVATYLAFAVDKSADYWSGICSWHSSGEKMRNTFARQAIPMVWDYAECNPFSDSTGNWQACVDWGWKVIAELPATLPAEARQLDATSALDDIARPLISTDPPYYDNIGYADLADFFYVWLRRSLGSAYPQLMSTLLVPKSQELVATPYRFDGDKRKAQEFFERGLGQAFERMRDAHDARFPLTVYYAFKQAESEDGDTGAASTGWETMLEGLIRAGFSVLGTWPMRSELSNRPVASGTNALASSIVLVCRPKPEGAPIATRGEFVSALKRELPEALKLLQEGSIAPVDLAQAAIGPGMAVFTRYVKVVESDGTAMRVRDALALINQVLDEVLAEQDADYDPATRFAIAWFEQRGFDEGPFGEAEVLAKAKGVSVDALARDGFLQAAAGKVRLLRRAELPDDWDPATDKRLTVWEVASYLVRAYEEGGERAAADLLARVGAAYGQTARELAYRLFAVCEKKGWSSEALPFNAFIVAWPEISSLAASSGGGAVQEELGV
ncbi:adenine-specific DNA methylase containing a Zn-ribbon [Coriobacteriaceae bacterium EMTCatB1]|nr:adenine-specific DNA methylase containing a Zn-ribbon [Coriobacteriaceae bacterium EMTCatB1]